MRRIPYILCIVALSGCANARHMCGLDDQPEWHQLVRAPTNDQFLLSSIPVEDGFRFPYERNHRYWFERSDGALLLCRQNPQQIDVGRCNSDGWIFVKEGEQWRARQEWATFCTS